jgi:hypothetical protein
MLNEADYLHVSKRRTHCAGCGASLVENECHPSVLVAPEGAGEWETPFDPAHAEAASQADAPDAAPPAADAETAGEEESKPPTKGPEKDAAPDAESSETNDAFLRLDYCATCWADIKERAYFSFWIGRRTESDQPPRKLNRVERNLALAALYDSLAERDDSETDFTPHLYFLAHLLMKFRIFKWQPGIEDPETGETVIRFTRTDAEDEVRLPEVEMPPELIATIKNEIEVYLEQSTGQTIRL